jgi:hypothetical protein
MKSSLRVFVYHIDLGSQHTASHPLPSGCGVPRRGARVGRGAGGERGKSRDAI